MPQQFLDGANVVACFQQVGGKTMAKHVRRHPFIYPGLFGRSFDGSLNDAFVHVIAVQRPIVTARVFGQGGSRKNKLPAPITFGVRVFPGEGVGEGGTAVTLLQILVMLHGR